MAFGHFRNGASVVAPLLLVVWGANQGRALKLVTTRTGTFVIFC